MANNWIIKNREISVIMNSMEQKQRYRLYVDETGTPNYPASSLNAAFNKRFLSLVGIIISEKEHHEILGPKFEQLKYILTGDYDESFPFHRQDAKERRGIYEKLREKSIEEKWNAKVEDIIVNTDYRILCVVIDKPRHLNSYMAPNHPYYYCMEVLLERYVKFLENVNATGDVMFEARGGKEDTESKRQYRRIYDYGTSFVGKELFQQRLTSKDLKLKTKDKMISGLEFADMLNLAAELDTLRLYGRGGEITSKFTKEIVEWIQNKYYHGGRKGYGRKLLP